MSTLLWFNRYQLKTYVRGAFLASFALITGCSSSKSGGGSSTPPPTSAPAITTQPASTSANVGATATFSVTATGSAPLAYGWQMNGKAITGATSSSYTTPALSAQDDGESFTVTVSNSAGSITSTAAKLTVKTLAPQITQQPSNISVQIGQTATFTVTATGTAPLNYQWTRDGQTLAGATSASYSLSDAQQSDSGSNFAVTVTNSAGSVSSGPASLTVTQVPIAITTQPTGGTYFVGEKATFTVVASGTSPAYQWYKNGAAIGGATGTSFTTDAFVAADDLTNYSVLVSNQASAMASAAAQIRIGPFLTDYTTQKGVKLSMYAWPGKKNAFLTKTNSYDPVWMRKILEAADSAYNYYAKTDGKEPSLYFNYQGLATIADTGIGGIDLCGAGCTFIGATGMELDDNTTQDLYNGVQHDTYNWVIFYEFGRSFWLFQSSLGFKAPDTSSCEQTGFAVYMGIHSLLELGYPSNYGTSIPNNPNPFETELADLDSYTADTSLNFADTVAKDSYSGPGGCSVLWAGMLERLRLSYGGEDFIQKVFKEALKRPAAASTQDAVDNWVLAVSAAARKNLTGIYLNKWRWPVSTAAQQYAQTTWGAPETSLP